MGLWDKLSNELVDIVEWLDETRDTMVWRFPRYQNEIKNGARLVVRESQSAAFINEGAMGDLFVHPGTYTLTTQNLPLLSTLKGWKFGFNSPFKAEVYFVSTRTFTEHKWGTKNPIMIRDPEFGPTRIRAFGSFAIRVNNPAVLLRNVVGTNQQFSVDDISGQLRDMMVARFANAAAESKIPVLDMAANQDELGRVLLGRVNTDFQQFGLEVTQLVVENISLPPEVEAAMDKRTSMGVLGNLDNYMKMQAANSLEKAAANPGGPAGLGVGFMMANQMAGMMQPAMQPQSAPQASGGTSSPSMPPPLPGAGVAFHAAIDGKQSGPFDLRALQENVDAGKITRQTLVWKAGMAAWTPAASVPELAELFAAVPPPLPPA